MSFSEKDIKSIAHLARLEIQSDESSIYLSHLNKIFNLVEQMNNIDADNIEPMAHPHDAKLRLREDLVTEHNQRDAFQAIAPETENSLYLVPQVIEPG